MNTYFENFNEEISQVITRSKKDNNTTIFRIQKSHLPYFHQVNNTVVESRIESIYGVNLHLLSSEGYIIYGASNRIHIPDVITRLYQTLENLLKANKGHKVRKNIFLKDLPKDEISNINFSDMGELDVEYLNTQLKAIYEQVSERSKDIVDIEFILDGNYSVWYIGNSLGGAIEHDDFILNLTCNLSLKSNSERKVTLTKVISPAEIRGNHIDIRNLLYEIDLYTSLLKNDWPSTSKTEIKPKAVILDKFLTNLYLCHQISQDTNVSGLENYSLHDKNSCESIDTTELTKFFDQFGFSLLENTNISNDENIHSSILIDLKDEKSINDLKKKVFRQNRFHYNPTLTFRNIVVSDKNETDDISISGSDNIQTVLDKIKTKFGLDNILFLAGHKNNQINLNDKKFKVPPTIALYFDGKNISNILDYHVLNLSEVKEINLLGNEGASTLIIANNELPITIKGLEASLIKFDESEETFSPLKKSVPTTKVIKKTK